MDYQIIPIEKLKPDPAQPRRYIDQEALNEMAISIKNEGLINPIEVDKNFVIVTGELRWRASKIAGLKEVPVKILENISLKERFIRQVQENTHQNTMAPLDTAMALDKIRKTLLSSAAELQAKEGRGGFRHGEKGVEKLHELLGMPESTISEYLDLLRETGELKEALKDPKFSRTKVVVIKEAPEKYREKLRHIVATQKSIPRDTVRHIATALRRADRYGEDEDANKLLNENFEKLTTVESLTKINKIVLDDESRIKEPAGALRFIPEKVIELMELLDRHPLNSFDDFHRPLVIKDIIGLGFYLGGYLKGKDMKKLEVPKTKLLK